MYKQIAIMVFTLITAIISIIGLQWYIFSLHQTEAPNESSVKISEEVILRYDGMRFQVEQSIFGLNRNEQYDIRLPDHARNVQCKGSDETDCFSKQNLQPSSIHLENVEHVKLLFDYAVEKNKLLDEWNAQITARSERVIPESIAVSIVMDKGVPGQWISQAVPEEMSKEYVKTLSWRKEVTSVIPLYLTEDPIRTSQLGTNIQVTYDETIPANQVNQLHQMLKHLPINKPIKIVFTKRAETKIGDGFAVVNVKDANKLDIIASITYLRDQLAIDMEEEWLYEPFASILVKKPVGTGKAKELSSQLLDVLSEQEQKLFIDELMNNKKSSFKLQEIDRMISKATGKGTTFFSNLDGQNGNEMMFVLTDNRPIFINEVKYHSEWSPLYFKERLYLPVVEVLKPLGYEVKPLSTEETLLIKKGQSSWRIYSNKDYFVHNEDQYGLFREPVKTIRGRIYLSEDWFEDVLKIDVVKRADGIYIE